MTRVVYTRLRMPAPRLTWRGRLPVNIARVGSDGERLGWYVRIGSTGYARYRLPVGSPLRDELEFFRAQTRTLSDEVARLNRELEKLRRASRWRHVEEAPGESWPPDDDMIVRGDQ